MNLMCSLWMGRAVSELPREELLEVIEWCGKEIERLRADQARRAPYVDWLRYLMRKPKARP